MTWSLSRLQKWQSGGIPDPDCPEPVLFDRPVRRVFGGIFPDVPVLGFILDSGGFTRDKTGLIGAVWVEDREEGWGNLCSGGLAGTGWAVFRSRFSIC